MTTNSKRKVKGFDYIAGKEVERTLADWRALTKAQTDKGCQRRVENGETFVHDINGRILFEVYANVR